MKNNNPDQDDVIVVDDSSDDDDDGMQQASKSAIAVVRKNIPKPNHPQVEARREEDSLLPTENDEPSAEPLVVYSSDDEDSDDDDYNNMKDHQHSMNSSRAKSQGNEPNQKRKTSPPVVPKNRTTTYHRRKENKTFSRKDNSSCSTAVHSIAQNGRNGQNVTSNNIQGAARGNTVAASRNGKGSPAVSSSSSGGDTPVSSSRSGGDDRSAAVARAAGAASIADKRNLLRPEVATGMSPQMQAQLIHNLKAQLPQKENDNVKSSSSKKKVKMSSSNSNKGRNNHNGISKEKGFDSNYDSDGTNEQLDHFYAVNDDDEAATIQDDNGASSTHTQKPKVSHPAMAHSVINNNNNKKKNIQRQKVSQKQPSGIVVDLVNTSDDDDDDDEAEEEEDEQEEVEMDRREKLYRASSNCEDGNRPKVPTSTVADCKNNTQSPSKPQSQDVIDLLSSDDEEELDKKLPATTTKINQSFTMREKEDDDDDDDDGDDDDDDDEEEEEEELIVELPTESITTNGNKDGSNRNKFILPRQGVQSLRKQKSHDIKDTLADDSDDDDDDSLLNCKSGLSLSRNRPAKKVTNIDHEDSETSTPHASTPVQSSTTIITPSARKNNSQNTVQSSQNLTVTGSTISNSSSGGPSNHQQSTTGLSRPQGIRNPYTKPRTPSTNTIASTTASPGVFYPKIGENTKYYPDLRPRMILGFWKVSRKLTFHSKDRPKMDQMIQKLVQLALSQHPIRSLEEYCHKHSSVQYLETLKQDIGDYISKSLPIDACRDERYYSIAEACLVTMAVRIEQQRSRDNSHEQQLNHLIRDNMNESELSSILSNKDAWMSLSHLIPNIDRHLKKECPACMLIPEDDDHGAAYYINSSTRSAEYRQIEKLWKKDTDSGMSYIKKHQVRGEVYFELTTLGYRTAKYIRNRTFPAAQGHYRCSNIKQQVEARYQGICLAVDRQEGGGAAHNLHKMCNKLDMTKIPYFVCTLKIGDYCFFSGNHLCPLLVERKSIQDIALSIHDGRWVRQKQRMYHGQFIFGYDNCRLAFIIEGKQERQQVTGGYIGHRQYNVSLERLEEEIANLQKEGFDVLRTTSPENSMFELSRWAQRVAKEVQRGGLKLRYTYQEFKDKVKKIPPGTDFSRLAKYAMQERLEKEEDNQASANKKNHREKDIGDSSSDDEGLRPQLLDPKLQKCSTNENALQQPIEKDKHNNQAAANKKRRRNNEIDDEDTSSEDEDLKVHKLNKRCRKEDISAKHENDETDYSKWSQTQLQSQCVRYGLPKTGSKAALIERLNGPRPPEVWIRRKDNNEYVPARHDTGATALLVGLWLKQREVVDDKFKGLQKDELYVLAESLEISKNPFSGGTTQTGPYHYDGWSNMSKLLAPGDPSLVIKLKGARYKLTRNSPTAGFQLAKAMHKWCHQHNKCKCRDLGYEYKDD